MTLGAICIVLSFAILMIQGEITYCPCARMRTTPEAKTEEITTTQNMKDVTEPKLKPSITFSDRPPLHFVGFEGETHEFLCSGESPITMETVTWQLPDHVTISNDTSTLRSGVYITHNNSMVIYKMSTNHRGRYICRLSFDDIIAEAPMQLVVVPASETTWTARMIIGAASLTGFLVTCGVIHLGYKVYLCRASGLYHDPDFGAQVPLRQL
ncbi:uncharacterized protein [Haliotis asinina]|uniref:uncharacterized protein n=1 Tax=Haliotis asinina TaxID=109174 RepID=UPI003531CFC3